MISPRTKPGFAGTLAAFTRTWDGICILTVTVFSSHACAPWYPLPGTRQAVYQYAIAAPRRAAILESALAVPARTTSSCRSSLEEEAMKRIVLAAMFTVLATGAHATCKSDAA